MPAPSPFYRQHHDLEAPRIDAAVFRPAWRRKTRLDALSDDNLITFREWLVACSWRATIEYIAAAIAPRSTLLSLDKGGRPGAGWHDLSPGVLDAGRRVSRLAGAFRPHETMALVRFLVDDAPFSALASYWGGIDPRTAKKLIVNLLRRLGRLS
jgi:hypothetical protein